VAGKPRQAGSLGRRRLLASALPSITRTPTRRGARRVPGSPLGENAFTLQADYIRYDGDTTFATLPRRHTLRLEGGLYLRRWQASVFTQLGRRDLQDGRAAGGGDTTY
jgi:hypothetical protein